MRRHLRRLGLVILAAALAVSGFGCSREGAPREILGHWVDANGITVLDIRSSKMTVTGGWNNIYQIKTETESGVTYLANTKDGGSFGVMSRLEIREDGLIAYEQVLDAEGHIYHFVREEDVAAYREIRDLSTDAPMQIESKELESFSLVFRNSGGSYGLDPALVTGDYSWTLERREEGGYTMSLRVMGQSYVAFDFEEDVTAEYAKGLARLLEDAGIVALNGYYRKNDMQAFGWSLYADYASGETLSLRAAGDAAAECPFDLPLLMDYAMEQAPELKR